MTEKITPNDFLEILRGAEKSLDCKGHSCLLKCPLAFHDVEGKFDGCLSVEVRKLVLKFPKKCPTCGAVKI